MTVTKRHIPIPLFPEDANRANAAWQSALPEGSATHDTDQRLIGPANPWVPTQVALVDPALRNCLRAAPGELSKANGPMEGSAGPRVIVLTQTSEAQATEWLAEVAGSMETVADSVRVISTPEDNEAVTCRIRRLCGEPIDEWRHGVFLEISGLGVLIRGSAGIGKSEVALELISRGHRLIADDAPCFTAHANEVTGTSPDRLFGLLEVRGIGIMDIGELFGSNALKTRKYLRLIVDLYPADGGHRMGPEERLFGDRGTEEVAGRSIPVWRLPVAPGRNLAVLLEAIVRQRNLERQRSGKSTSSRLSNLIGERNAPAGDSSDEDAGGES